MRELDKLVRARELAHGGNRLLAYGMRSLQVRRNLDGDLKPDPERSTGNIAAPLALLMALSRAVAPREEAPPRRRWRVLA